MKKLLCKLGWHNWKVHEIFMGEPVYVCSICKKRAKIFGLEVKFKSK